MPAYKSLSHKQFVYIAHRGKSVKTTHLSFQWIEREIPGLGITVSKKKGNAVLRNRFKRRIRHLFRTRSLPFAVVVTASSKETLLSPFRVLQQEWGDFLQKREETSVVAI